MLHLYEFLQNFGHMMHIINKGTVTLNTLDNALPTGRTSNRQFLRSTLLSRLGHEKVTEIVFVGMNFICPFSVIRRINIRIEMIFYIFLLDNSIGT